MTNQFLSTSELDFEGILDSLKSFLKQQDRFKDFNFEGSNLSVLLEVLAQNTYLNGFYLNMVGTEASLDVAQLRESVISKAKELNYTPRSRTSARATVDVEVVPNGTSPNQIIIPKGYAFRSQINGKSTTFVTSQNHVITPSAGRYVASNITIYEGVIVKETFVVNSTSDENGQFEYSDEYILSSENLDTTSIEVTYTLPGSTSPRTLTKAESLLGLMGNSQVFFLEAYADNHYKIVLGTGVFGVGLPQGTVLTVQYRDTIGAEANGIRSFLKTSSIDGYSSITVATRDSAYGGAERESTESIRFTAPRHFQTQYRTVVPSDYDVLIRANFPEIVAVAAYGGEVVKQYGKVIISVKPEGINTTVPSSLKSRMTNFLKSKNLTGEPVFVEPDYFFLNVDSRVKYDLNLVTLNTSQIKSAITTRLVDLNNTMFNKFGVDVRPSRIENIIDESDPSITGNDTSYRLIKRVYPSVNFDNSISINFANKLFSIGVENITRENASVITNNFTILEDDDSTSTVFIMDNGLGQLHLYKVTTNGFIKVNGTVGVVDYATGQVWFKFKPKGYTSHIAVIARLQNRDASITNNMFVSIDPADINITMVVDSR